MLAYLTFREENQCCLQANAKAIVTLFVPFCLAFHRVLLAGELNVLLSTEFLSVALLTHSSNCAQALCLPQHWKRAVFI